MPVPVAELPLFLIQSCLTAAGLQAGEGTHEGYLCNEYDLPRGRPTRPVLREDLRLCIQMDISVYDSYTYRYYIAVGWRCCSVLPLLRELS